MACQGKGGDFFAYRIQAKKYYPTFTSYFRYVILWQARKGFYIHIPFNSICRHTKICPAFLCGNAGHTFV